jgi:hypothetical protein
VSFDVGLPETVEWYRDNPAWVAGARSGDWDSYYARQYGERLAAGRAVAATGDDAGTWNGGHAGTDDAGTDEAG